MAESTEQMSLEGILGGEKAPEKVVPEKKTELEIPVLGEKPAGEVKDPVEKQQAERNISRKQAMRDKEQDAQGRVRDKETGQYVAKTPPKEEAVAPAKAEESAKPAAQAAPDAAVQQEFTEKEKAFLRAAQEERGKRQALEARLAAIEAAKPQEPAKTFWDDPEAALKAHEDRIRQESTNARLQMAEFSARQRHADFDEKIATFSQVAQQTPGLIQQWLAAPDPAEYAYQLGKNHLELKQVGSLEEMRAKIERETTTRVRAEVEAELKAKAEALEKARAAIPESLSAARSTGTANRPVWSGPTPLDSILGKG